MMSIFIRDRSPSDPLRREAEGRLLLYNEKYSLEATDIDAVRKVCFSKASTEGEPAMAALASVGSFKAASKTFETSLFMVAILPDGPRKLDVPERAPSLRHVIDTYPSVDYSHAQS